MNFTYNGKSTDDFNVMIVSFDHINTLESGLQREIIKGESTDFRLIPNFFGTTYSSVIEFTRSFVKKDGSVFTKEEISSIARWLTSSRLPKQLIFHHKNASTEDTEQEIYHGIFTNLQYNYASSGIIGITFTFTNDSPFIRVPMETTFTLEQSENTIQIECNSDLTEDYIYPVLALCYDSAEQNQAEVTITNMTDNHHQMKLKCLSKLETTIDCQHLTVSDITGQTGYNTLGWSDIDDIYWLRLLHGTNELKIETSAAPLKVTLAYSLLKKGGEPFEA